MNTTRIKALAIVGLPLTPEEEAEYLLLLANDEEFRKYMEAKKGGDKNGI